MFAFLVLGGCGAKIDSNKLLESNFVEKVGTISTKSGDEYLLITLDEIVNIASNKLNLDNYINRPIRVRGMFSGSTLYVDKIVSAITN